MARIQIRELQRGDRATVAAVFAGLSPASRLRRFHAPVKILTPRMAAGLADVDGDRHVALVASVGRGRRREPVGIARYVREPDGSAEIAIAVADHVQGRGVGTRLLAALVERARRDGVRVLYGDLLADNEPVRRLVGRALPAPRFTRNGAVVRVESVLAPGPITLDDVLYDLEVASPARA